MKRLQSLVGVAALAALLAGAGEGRAVQPDEILSNGGLEGRARTISAEVRCLVCQNQSIDDSDAPLARDLRLLVRERLQAGDTDRGVRDFIVARYGPFVLLRPPVTWSTLVLWFAPAGLVAAAVAGLVLARRRRSSLVSPAPFSREEEARIAALVSEGRPPS